MRIALLLITSVLLMGAAPVCKPGQYAVFYRYVDPDKPAATPSRMNYIERRLGGYASFATCNHDASTAATIKAAIFAEVQASPTGAFSQFDGFACRQDYRCGNDDGFQK